MRFFDAWVNHFNEDISIVSEFYHQFLALLHIAKWVFINLVSVIEKQIILRGQFYFHILKLVSISTKSHNLHSDCFKSANFLRTTIGILDSKFEWCFTIKDYVMAFSKRWVHFFNCREVKCIQHWLLSHIISVACIFVLCATKFAIWMLHLFLFILKFKIYIIWFDI